MNREFARTKTPSSAPVRHFTVLLSATRRGAQLARLLAVAQLRTWGLPSEAAAHLVAELASNAVLHGRVPGRDFRLALSVTGDDTLRIEVTDARGDRLLAAADEPANGDAESGRGLLLVESLADRWGVVPGPPPCKTVWAELTLPVDDQEHATARRTFHSSGAGASGRSDTAERMEEILAGLVEGHGIPAQEEPGRTGG